MRNTIVAAAAALSLIVSAGATFAAQQGSGNGRDQTQANEQSSNVDTNCDNILANPSGHTRSDVDQCRAKSR